MYQLFPADQYVGWMRPSTKGRTGAWIPMCAELTLEDCRAKLDAIPSPYPRTDRVVLPGDQVPWDPIYQRKTQVRPIKTAKSAC